MSDKSMIAVVYSEPVYYKDGDKFKEIDNSLTENGSVYENTDNPFKVKLSKDPKEKKLVTVNSEGHEVSWEYVKKNRKLKNLKIVKKASSENTTDNLSIDEEIQKTGSIEILEENSDEKWISDVATKYKPEVAAIENFKTKKKN